MTVLEEDAVQAGLNTYKFFVNMLDPTDQISAVYGNADTAMYVNVPDGAFNTPFNSSWCVWHQQRFRNHFPGNCGQYGPLV